MKLGKTSLDIPVLGLGTWALAGGSSWGDSDEKVSAMAVDKALEMGLYYFDTAPAYTNGGCETLLGKLLKGRRDKVFLATKCGLRWDLDKGFVHMQRDGATIIRCLKKESVIWECEQSLKRLGTDHIDMYITHWPDPDVAVEETVEALELLKKQGKILYYGASNVNEELVAKYGEGLSLIQERFSLLNRKNEKLFSFAKQKGITCQAYSPLERGMLSGSVSMDTVAQGIARDKVVWYQEKERAATIEMLKEIEKIAIAHNASVSAIILAWTWAQGIHVLCGGRKPNHVQENALAGNIVLSAQEICKITELGDKVREATGHQDL
ncbi:MAG: aldo/keto reductase [Sphaerochaetaceae bacterium]|nr:aldo/keto reductase [Sphaerochaetaceae bacterium]